MWWIGPAVVIAAAGVLVGWKKLHPQVAFTVRIQTSRTIGAGMLVRDVSFARPGSAFTIRCVSFPASRVRLRTADVRALSDSPLRAAAADVRNGCAINGGYFDSQFAPEGLFRIAGVTATPSSPKPLLAACIVGDAGGNLQIVPADSPVAATATFARQCGPYLVGPGEPLGNRSAKAERSAVAINFGRVAVLTSSAASLDELAEALTVGGGALGVPNVRIAVNLDGGPSSAMRIFHEGQPDGAEPRGRITDALIFEEVREAATSSALASP